MRRSLEHSEVRGAVSKVVTNMESHLSNAGTAVMALLDSDTLRIEGYFEENKLRRIRLGDAASARLLGSDHDLRDTAESISAGIEGSRPQLRRDSARKCQTRSGSACHSAYRSEFRSSLLRPASLSLGPLRLLRFSVRRRASVAGRSAMNTVFRSFGHAKHDQGLSFEERRHSPSLLICSLSRFDGRQVKRAKAPASEIRA